MHLYHVGELYHPGRTSWPEQVEYNYRGGGHELRIFLRSPSRQEIAAIERGRAEFGLYVEGGVIFLLYTIEGGFKWSDAPFSIWLVPDSERELPDPAAQGHALVSLLLVDSDTGILRAMRALTWSPEFTAAMEAAIRAQADAPFEEGAHDRAIRENYARFPSPQLMLEHAIARTTGGD